VHDAITAVPEHIVALADEPLDMYCDVPRDLDQVPRFFELTKGFRRLTPGRATGEDTLPPELFIKFPHLMARIFHQIMVEASLKFVEPAQWKGGMLAFFPKPSGSAHICSANREIVLGDIPGKFLHRCRRSRLLPYLLKKARPSQMGGLHHRPTDFGSLALRTLMERSRCRKRSFAAIFVDISAAFYYLC